MAKIGYARVSSKEQNLDRQIHALESVSKVFSDKVSYQAESERKRIKERQAQGIAIAKQRGRFKGRKKKYSFEDEGLQHAFELYEQGLTEKEIERKTGINRTTFRRYREKYKISRRTE